MRIASGSLPDRNINDTLSYWLVSLEIRMNHLEPVDPIYVPEATFPVTKSQGQAARVWAWDIGFVTLESVLIIVLLNSRYWVISA